MEYLLVMAISGSTMTVVCLLLRRLLLKDKVSARLYYLLTKAAVLYYLVPLPFLKRWYWKVIWTVVLNRKMEIAQIPLTLTNYAVHADGKLYVNAYAEIQMAAVLVWLVVACFLMAVQLWEDLRTARWIAGYTSVTMTDQQRAFIGELKKQYGIRRRVLLYQGETGEPSMTFGIYRPVIICGREVGSREAELLTCHELVHIKRLDAFWKILLQIIMFLHWWNPLMWMLRGEFNRVCEMSCDETVMLGKSEEEINEYLHLLIAEALDERKTEKTSLRWKVGFGDNKRKIRERMNNLMNKKKWSRFAAVALMATLVFANSMTVFAYRDTFQREIPEETSQEEVESLLQKDIAQFVPDEADGETAQAFSLMEVNEIRYDKQFTDEEGNIYPVPEGVPYRGCNHDFVSGELTDHGKTSGGGCVVTVYRAQRCGICGYVIQGEMINQVTYKVCPHG